VKQETWTLIELRSVYIETAVRITRQINIENEVLSLITVLVAASLEGKQKKNNKKVFEYDVHRSCASLLDRGSRVLNGTMKLM
jgi:hypothetical protein